MQDIALDGRLKNPIKNPKASLFARGKWRENEGGQQPKLDL